MSRAHRLLDLLQLLRRHRRPVSGAKLAEALGVSLRTLYRDIEVLNAQGASIEGEAGLGYVLRPGYLLPPLMFTEEEIEALVLGIRWVEERGDGPLGEAAGHALAKIAAVLPPELKDEAFGSGLLVGPVWQDEGEAALPVIRAAIRNERKLHLSYIDRDGSKTRRTVWPFAVGFFDRARVVAAWCELRQDYRHFRTDRIAAVSLADERYPRRQQVLLKEWRAAEKIPTADKI